MGLTISPKVKDARNKRDQGSIEINLPNFFKKIGV